MFISWEMRHMFQDNLEAIAWQRGTTDCSRLVPCWDFQYGSKLDPVVVPVKQLPVR